MSRPLAFDDPHAEHRFVRLREVQLHCVHVAPTHARAREPVLLLHGFPEFWYAWRHQLAGLAAAGLHVYAPDLRGYNLSDKPDTIASYTVERLADDIAELIDALGLGTAHVVGHDWGGMVAWWLAMRHPQRVARLSVLNCPHPAHQLAMMFDPVQLRRSFYMLVMQLPGVAERRLAADDFAVLRRILRRDPAREGANDDADIARYVEAMARDGGHAAMHYYRALLRRNPWRLRRSLRPIELPVQVIWGAKDRHLGFEYAEPPAKWVWHCRFDVLESASHWVHVDAPDEVDALLLEFMDEVQR
ncbi:MAG: alpha/beta hydrolase [Nannocystaceae bacterium]|nr:alpha/beta hydrolase [Nannocystaceae bacterium]